MTKEIIYVPVSVEDELPKEDGFYYCIFDDGDKGNNWFRNGEWFSDACEYLKAEPVTHWLKPIPASEYATLQTSSLEAENKKLKEDINAYIGLPKALSDLHEKYRKTLNLFNAAQDENEVLRKALQNLVDDVKSKPNDTRYATAVSLATQALNNK